MGCATTVGYNGNAQDYGGNNVNGHTMGEIQSYMRMGLPVMGLLVTREAATYIGTPYASPPNVPATFDCSSFINYVYARFGYALPSVTSAIGNSGKRISWEEALPGDILIFSRTRGSTVIDHAAILWKKSDNGELVGSWIIHAASVNTGQSMHRGNPTSRTGVVLTELGRRGDGIPDNEYFYQRYMYTIRVLKN
ncbi:MAG: NlpC/P60 family protein [Treponema sp.]|nr:NlpC/P60 family protein [Treponema sp.]